MLFRSDGILFPNITNEAYRNISPKAKTRRDEFYKARKILVNRQLRLSGSRKQQRTHGHGANAKRVS